MYRPIIAICAIFCAIAAGAGLVVAFSTRQSSVAVQVGRVSTTSVPTIALPAPTAVSSALAPTSAATSAASGAMPTSAPPAPTKRAQPTAALSPTANTASATEKPGYIEYTVKKGDILYTIAAEHNVTVEAILAINQIPNPRSLTVGQLLRIPNP